MDTLDVRIRLVCTVESDAELGTEKLQALLARDDIRKAFSYAGFNLVETSVETRVAPKAGFARVGEKYSFIYPGEPKYNTTVTVTEVTGFGYDDLVFFDDGSHSRQKHMFGNDRVVRVP